LRPINYILSGRTPVEQPNLFRWGEWMKTADRHVRHTEQGDVRVSTVFLGLDHNFSDCGPPILFETMAFVGHDSVGCERYSTWAKAELGHDRWVQQVFKATPILTLPTDGA
jgi:hypothetical protein